MPVVDVDGLQVLLDQLHGRGYTVVAPTVRDGVVIHAAIESVADLPRGVGDSQHPGSYGIVHRDDELLFGYAACAQSWKPWLFPAEQLMWRAQVPSELVYACEEALRSGEPAGTVQMHDLLSLSLPPVRSAASSHALDLAGTVELGLALGQLPRRLLLVGVEAATVAVGADLSPAVRAAVDEAVQAVVGAFRRMRGAPPATE